MGRLTDPPTFLPNQPPIQLGAVGTVLKVTSTNVLGFGAASGGGGGFAARYTAALAANTNNLNPGSGWPNADVSARLIITPSASINITGLVAGNDGEAVMLWNNATIVSGFTIILVTASGLSTAGNLFLTSDPTGAGVPPQSGVLLVYDSTIADWLVTP